MRVPRRIQPDQEDGSGPLRYFRRFSRQTEEISGEVSPALFPAGRYGQEDLQRLRSHQGQDTLRAGLQRYLTDDVRDRAGRENPAHFRQSESRRTCGGSAGVAEGEVRR